MVSTPSLLLLSACCSVHVTHRHCLGWQGWALPYLPIDSAGTDCRSDGAVRYYDNCVCRVVSVCQCIRVSVCFVVYLMSV